MTIVSVQRIENAIRIVAGLIDQTGEDFWPVLDRLERERDALAEREARLAKYLAQDACKKSPTGRKRHLTATSGKSLADLER
jgi:hypothetical protein